ncbi:MAG: hypothetical protein OMM_08731 [Candidatus Magnetoglobus multicellularis str. Araruama]|uniref:Uncharacterized protein n=1 Tax=Candidatus Magnetoglobus multicellularis str. Araruama TaxID=890399 RepID=A0A1V1P6Y3_9BACT|nr:MAG: hypothetical protein OMM_08731 [Candidatus Magnetoglobus multicellularis str. Araruama]
MKWQEIQTTYPDQWVIIEALKTHTTQESIRSVDEASVIEKCSDGGKAMSIYRKYHLENPSKEYYFAHTSREKLDIPERIWLGVRC